MSTLHKAIYLEWNVSKLIQRSSQQLRSAAVPALELKYLIIEGVMIKLCNAFVAGFELNYMMI